MMFDITQKYNNLRSELRHGDIVLFRGTSNLSKLFQWGDNAYYNHCGLIVKTNLANKERLLIADSVVKGVHPDFLSLRMKEYVDFCIVRPNLSKEKIDAGVEMVINKVEDGIKYDYWMLLRIGMYRKFGWKLSRIGNEKKDVCSEFTGRRYAVDGLGINSYREAVDKFGWITPHDHVRYAGTEMLVLYDSSLL